MLLLFMPIYKLKCINFLNEKKIIIKQIFDIIINYFIKIKRRNQWLVADFKISKISELFFPVAKSNAVLWIYLINFIEI